MLLRRCCGEQKIITTPWPYETGIIKITKQVRQRKRKTKLHAITYAYLSNVRCQVEAAKW